MPGIVHGGGLSAAMAAYGGRRETWLDLSTGINPDMPDLPEVPAEVWNRLPDQALVDAVRAAARDWYLGEMSGRTEGGISQDGPAFSGRPDDRGSGPFGAGEKTRTDYLPLAIPGTQALIQILPRLVPQDRPVAIVSPTYGEYAHCFRGAGFKVDLIPSVDALSSAHGALVVVNPNNPDGRSWEPEVLRAVHAELAARGGHLHVDEAFGDGRPGLSLARDACLKPGLTVSRSFGKFFGMAGIRLGFVFSQPETLERIETALGPWAVSGPALHVAADLLKRSGEPILGRIQRRRSALGEVLATAGLAVAGGTELFALVEDPEAQELFEHLCRAHILVRKFDYAPSWLRIGLAADEQGDRKLAGALASFAR